MKNLSCSWVTIKHEDKLFDVRLSNHKAIEEIRMVDSEIDIAPMLNKKTIRFLKFIISKTNHTDNKGGA